MTPTRTRSLRDIDPETARGLIANCISEEHIDEKWVHSTAIQMKKGRFDTYGACLEIDSRGNLTQGLPYLMAIVESGVIVRIWVAKSNS